MAGGFTPKNLPNIFCRHCSRKIRASEKSLKLLNKITSQNCLSIFPEVVLVIAVQNEFDTYILQELESKSILSGVYCEYS